MGDCGFASPLVADCTSVLGLLLAIDRGTYHLLPVDRTRAVHVEDGEICSGDEVASASWSFDGDVMSSTGSASLQVVGGDTLVRQNLGDDAAETAVGPFDGDVASAIADWLDENGLRRGLPPDDSGNPGLTAEERSALDNGLWLSVSVHVAADAVVECLCAGAAQERFRRALAEPESPDGKRLYPLLRDVAAGREDVRSRLARLM